ncbi:MAG: Coenzyme F420-0:L-glutamate ligase @ F420-1:L-glutamate ligase, partial [uncultured Thermomicrobiales bacterium]
AAASHDYRPGRGAGGATRRRSRRDHPGRRRGIGRDAARRRSPRRDAQDRLQGRGTIDRSAPDCAVGAGTAPRRALGQGSAPDRDRAARVRPDRADAVRPDHRRDPSRFRLRQCGGRRLERRERVRLPPAGRSRCLRRAAPRRTPRAHRARPADHHLRLVRAGLALRDHQRGDRAVRPRPARRLSRAARFPGADDARLDPRGRRRTGGLRRIGGEQARRATGRPHPGLRLHARRGIRARTPPRPGARPLPV